MTGRYVISEEIAPDTIRNVDSTSVRRVAMGAARDLVQTPTGPHVRRVIVWDAGTASEIFNVAIERWATITMKDGTAVDVVRPSQKRSPNRA